MTTPNYLFRSARLGFRNWLDTDLEIMDAINTDPLVMEFFPGIKTREETSNFIVRMQQELAAKGFCYFAVDKLDDGKFIGFIGLSEQTFMSDFTPCIDIGWRLHSLEWGQGFATEGAKACLAYGFETLQLPSICSIAPAINTKSENVMKKIGMEKVKNFKHPLLKGNERLEECVLYKIIPLSEP